MPYAPISETEFNNRYQLLAAYIQADGANLNANDFLKIRQAGLNNFLPDGHALKGKNIFVVNRTNRKSFLHLAAAKENLFLIKFLKETGHEIDRQDAQHKTPLYDACNELKLAAVNRLLGYDADPNLGNGHLKVKVGNQEYTGETVPLVAAIESTAIVTRAELSAATGEDFSGLTDQQATEQARARLTKSLIAKGAQTDLQTGQENFSAFHRAIGLRKSLVVKEIADSGPDEIFRQFDRDGEVALHMVAAYRNKEEKENERTEMQEEKEITDIVIASAESAKIQELLTIKELLDGNAPLHTAVICSNFDVVNAIYKSDYKFTDLKILSIQNKHGNTAIHEAVKDAWRGPKILAFLLSVATVDDLNIKNNPILDANGVEIRSGETAGQMAERLLSEANLIHALVGEVEEATRALEEFVDAPEFEEDEIDQVDIPEEIGFLKTAIGDLRDSDPLDDKISKALSLELDDLFIELEKYEQRATFSLDDAEELVSKTRSILAATKEEEFFHPSYLDSLKNVKQEKYSAWRAEQIRLPRSFRNLDTVDSNLLNTPVPFELTYDQAQAWYSDGQNKYRHGAYQDAISSLKESIRLYNSNPSYSEHRSLAYAYDELANVYLDENSNDDARINLEKAIDIYHTVKEYNFLEPAYQKLAKTYVSEGELAISQYEETNRRKLHSRGNLGQLQGHLALAGLYKELKGQSFQSPHFSMHDLQMRESFHYHQAYKLTQGKMDNSAHVVLQREIGIANNANLGTYNIQQCVAVVAFEPASKKVVLSHFDKDSGPASFIDQLVEQFPGQTNIDLYISGGRDPVTLSSTQIPSKISDNNIDFVLKQIHLKNIEDSVDGNPENGRFKIKACDVGETKPSPEGIVFDVRSQRLVHATPNRADSSLESRAVNFMLQKNKADYLRPLNPVDFTKSATERTISFSAQEQQTIRDKTVEYTNWYANPNSPSERETWKHDQIFYPLMRVTDKLAGVAPSDFTQGLLTEFRRNYYQGAPLKAPQINDDDNIIYDQDLNKLFICLNRHKRELGLCTIDSKPLLEELAKLSEAKQSEALDYVATRRVGGTKQEEVATLVHNQKTTSHLQTTASILSHGTDGMFFEEALVDLSKGNATAAIQLAGFKASGYGLGKAAERLDEKGLSVLTEGKAVQSKLWRGGSRVVGRGTALLNIYNLVKDVKALNTNDTNALQDAKVRVASDIVYTSVDGVEIAVEVAEATSETMAELAISSVTGPAGEVVVAIVMVVNRIYDDVEIVEGENHAVHLTDWEKLKEGGLAFLALGPEDYIKKMVDEVTEYSRILPKKLEFLKNHPQVKHIIFPAINETGKSCRIVIGERSCSGGGLSFPPTCTNEKTVCDPTFTDYEDNYVYFKDKLIGFTLTREEITAPEGSELLCVPTGGEEGKSLPKGGAYACDRALGLTNINSTGNAAFYNLGEGVDHAVGFEDIPNIFMVNNGAKDYEGGKQDDVYIVQATQVWTALPIDGEENGGLNGAEGSDSLILSGFQPAIRIEIDLNEGYLQAGNNTLALTSIEKLVGGTFPLTVTAACATEVIDTEGGPTLRNPDILLIPRNTSCDYNLKMHLHPNTVVTNAAEVGNFTYYILPGKGNVAVNLTRTEDNANTKPLKQQFVFNALISDVSSISFSTSDDEQSQAIKLHFIDHRMRTLSRKTDKISFSQPNATANVSIAYQFKSDSYKAPFVLPTQLQTNRTRELLKKHLVNPAADSFNVTLTQPHEIRHALLNLINDESVEDFTFELNAYLSASTSLQFIDNAELIIGKKNLYITLKTDQSIKDIMRIYPPIARRLNIIFIITTLQNETVVIGHNGREVMYNNPLARTHLNGNGGEGLFVIKSGMESLLKSQLPVKEVVLYRRPEDTHVDSLDLRELNAQVRAINATTKIRFEKPNKRNKLGKNDLKLMVGMQTEWTPAKKAIPIVEILLKDVQNHWHKKYLHIYLNGLQAHRIAGRHSHLHLKPEPLKFGSQHELAIVGIKDVAVDSDIIIPHAYQPGAFFHHNQTNLLWTNMLSNSSNQVLPFTLIVEKFFQEPILKTLTLQFTNKKIALKNKLTQLNATKDFEEASNARLANLRAASLAILSSQPLDLHPTNQPTNASEIEVSRDQEHYLDNDIINDINATSVEDHTEDYSGEETNEINVFRRRRAAEDISDPTATSSASGLQSWIQFPRLLAENIVRATGEIFTNLGANITNLSVYLQDINFSGNPDLLNQSQLLGNKTSHLTDQLNVIQKHTLDASDVPLKKCVSLNLVDTDQQFVNGVSCSIPNARINFFHNIPFETRPTAFEQPEDNFANCQPLEWYGRPSVACEGEKTTAIVTPQLPQRIFDPIDGWIMLGQLTVAIINKFFSKPAAATDTRYQLVNVFLMKQALWDTKLNALEEQLRELHTRIDWQKLEWIQYRLEDRQEELEQFIKRNHIPWNEATEFTENLFALEKMLNEIKDIACPTSSSFQPRDNDVYARAASNESMASPARFLGLTRSGFFNGAANQNATARLNGPAPTQNLSRL
ncbi:ankyrin repeat domain-containing protein [Rickettsiella endosymbiont of Miltochrista miniata]|uniref:ankyrin repeat domain-containing protein n=1 Tax=Rickettsiella endosymbiont of Miltochrista miniata TaxID=3066239 RepID=UPI00313D2642